MLAVQVEKRSTTDTTGRDQHILIIGAGVTGCIVTQGLNKAGIPYSLFESESSASRPRTREWGMSIHWSRPLLEQQLPAALLARLREAAAVDPSFDSTNEGEYAVPFYNAKTGEHIIDIPMKDAIRISRRKCGGYALRDLILREVGAVCPLDVVLCNVNVGYDNAERTLEVRKLNPMTNVALQPGKALSIWTSVQDMSDPEKPGAWIFQLMPTSLTIADRGQDLNHCIADAKDFIQAIVDVKEGCMKTAEAVTAYDVELVKHGAQEVEASRKNALLVHDFEKFRESPVLKQGYTRGQK